MTSHKAEKVVNFESIKNLLKLSKGKFTLGELVCVGTIEQCINALNILKVNRKDKRATLFEVIIVCFC